MYYAFSPLSLHSLKISPEIRQSTGCCQWHTRIEYQPLGASPQLLLREPWASAQRLI